MFTTRHRAIAAATAAAIALSSMAITPAAAGPYRYSHRGGGNAAVLGAMAGVFGAIALLAARSHQELSTVTATAISVTLRRLRCTAITVTARTAGTNAHYQAAV
jgi:hypothetical protein